MSRILAMVVALAGQVDGGTSSAVPNFHEPMTRPVPVKRIEWRYPPELAARHVSGLLVVACVLSEEGVVEDCEAVKPLAGATDWAIAKLKSTRYTPVTLDGKPVRVRYVYSIRLPADGKPAEPSPPQRWRPVVPKQMRESCRGSNAPVCNEVALSLLRPDGGTRMSTGPHGSWARRARQDTGRPARGWSARSWPLHCSTRCPNPAFRCPPWWRGTRAASCPPRAGATTASSSPVR